MRKLGKGSEDMETKSALDSHKHKKGLHSDLFTKMRLKAKKRSSSQFGEGLHAPRALRVSFRPEKSESPNLDSNLGPIVGRGPTLALRRFGFGSRSPVE